MPDQDDWMNTQTTTREDDSELESVLSDAFPETVVTDLSTVAGDGPNPVVTVQTEGGNRFVVKFATATEHIVDLRRELTVTNYVRRETDVPVVAPVRYNFEDEWPAYVVFPHADGRTLEDALASVPQYLHPELFSNVGEMLATLHSQTSFDRFGEIVPTGPASFEIKSPAEWPEQFARHLADHVEALQGTQFEDIAEEVWSEVSNQLRDLETGANPVLLHGDIGEGNVLYTGTDVSGIVDWERAFAGHPEYDLCRAEVRYFLNDWGRPSHLQAMFYSGYRSVRTLSSGFENRRRWYLATFYLLALTQYSEWAPTVTDDLDRFAEQLSDKIRDIMYDETLQTLNF